MKRYRILIPAILSLLALPALVLAEASTPDDLVRPRFPVDATGWSGSMVIVILAMFLMAAVVGPVVRAEMKEEPAPDHDDHGHGH
jgi:hypothetical protein